MKLGISKQTENRVLSTSLGRVWGFVNRTSTKLGIFETGYFRKLGISERRASGQTQNWVFLKPGISGNWEFQNTVKRANTKLGISETGYFR